MVSQKNLNWDEAKDYQNGVAVLCSLVTVIVFLRLLSRKVSNISLWWDDAFIIIGTLFAWATAAVYFYAVSLGLGKPDKELGFQANTSLHHATLMSQDLYYSCIAFTKFSILAFYRRLFPISEFRITTYVLIGVIAIWWITAVLISILNCTPISYNWDRTQPGGHCIDARKFVIAVGIPNIVTDVIMLLLPLPVIWQMKLQFKKKMALSAILSFGIFVIISSCIRLMYMIDTHNINRKISRLYLWTNIEPNVAIVCACLPIMLPLVRCVRGKLGFAPALPPEAPSPSPGLHWPRYHGKGRDEEISLDTTEQYASSHPGFDRADSSTPSSSSWTWRDSLPRDEAAARPTGEDPATGNVLGANQV